MSNPRQNKEYVMLREAIKKKNKVTARNLILNNASVNVPRTRGNSPLHWAIIKFDDLDIVTMLLDRGANIRVKNHRYQKPLDVAIENNKIEATVLLIRRGALVGEDLNAFILLAIKLKKDRMVEILVDYGMQNNPTTDLKIALNAAISQAQLQIVHHILPHCRFLTPSDQYIPREAIIRSGPEYKECIELLLKKNFTVDPNSKNDIDFVYATVKNGYLPIVLQLLQFGLDVDMVNPKTGLNLLKIACLHKHHEIVENLLKQNACLNVTTPTNTETLDNFSHNNCNHPLSFIIDTNDLSDVTCLHIAVTNRDFKMTKLLLGHGATIIDDPKFFYITCIAIQYNYKEIVCIFLDHGVNVNDIDSKGKTLLHYCLLPYVDQQDSRYDIAKVLLEKGADVYIQTPSNSLLFEAVKNEHSKIAQLFLDYNADTQYICPDGNSLLHTAVRNNFDIEFIKKLLKRNLPVNAANNNRLTPLLIACKLKSKYQVYIIKALLDYNANVHCTDNNLMTPLHFACLAQNLDVVTALLKRGADPNAANNKGQTPLHLVCAQEYVVFLGMPFKRDHDMASSIIQILLQHNANIEAVNEKSWTPLLEACYSGNDRALKCLLDNHANVNHTDIEKLTPLYIAAKNCKDNFEGVKILLEHKLNVHFIDKLGKSIIHIIVENDSDELIKYLARTQVNFNPVDKKGNTPLHIAVKQRSIQMTENLIKYGANVNILDKKNRTALRNATKSMIDLQDKLTVVVVMRWCIRFQWENLNDDLIANTYTNLIDDYKKIINILKIQVIKLKSAGLKVNNQNLKIVYESDDDATSSDVTSDEDDSDDEDVKIDILQLEVDCEQEIEKMRTENVGVNNITFYNLLTKNIHLLSRFVKNKKIRQTLDQEIYDEKFPLYMDIIRSRFRDAKFRYRMMHSAKKYFILNITQRLPNDCIDTIFSYLNIKDLKMFIRAMKPLDDLPVLFKEFN